MFLEQISGLCRPGAGSGWPQCDLRLLQATRGPALAPNLNLDQPGGHHATPPPRDFLRPWLTPLAYHPTPLSCRALQAVLQPSNEASPHSAASLVHRAASATCLQVQIRQWPATESFVAPTRWPWESQAAADLDLCESLFQGVIEPTYLEASVRLQQSTT